MTAKILLPALLTVGAFTLIVNSFGGQASAQVYVLQGESVTGTPEPAGTNCKYGGVKITSAGGASYVCSAEQQQTYLYSGSFGVHTTWEADLIYYGNDANYAKFCSAINKTFVKATTLYGTWNSHQTNGTIWDGDYYYGIKICPDDSVYITDSGGNPDFNVWKYSGFGQNNCGWTKDDPNYTLINRSLITCQ